MAQHRKLAISWPHVAGLVSTGMAFMLFVTYSGPYAWLAELQLSMWGRYYPILTLLALVLLFLVFTLQGIQLFRNLSGEARPRPLAVLRPIASPAAGARLANSPRPRRRVHPLVFVFFTPGVVITALGAFGFVRGVRNQQLLAVSAADLEAGQAPSSSWVEVSGRLLKSKGLAIKNEGVSPTTNNYVPVVSEGWQPGKQVAVFVEIAENRIESLDPHKPIRGMIAWPGLPGPLRATFERNGLQPSEKYVLVALDQRPDRAKEFGMIAVALGGVLLVLAFVAWLLGDKLPRQIGPRRKTQTSALTIDLSAKRPRQ